MIQDIEPHHLNNQYQHIQATINDYMIIIKEGKVYVESKEYLTIPHCIENQNYEYLLSVDDKKYFYPLFEVDTTLLEALTMREVLIHPQKETAFGILTANSIIRWIIAHQYCGRCGHSTILDTKERKIVCPSCHQEEYPKICPAVIVGIINGDSILLSRYNGGKMYALIAGFNEVGETIEQTVAREVKEETNLEVENLQYYKSQPWGLSDTLLFGFYCEVKGDSTIHVDHQELQEADFYLQENIPATLDRGSLTAEMIMLFKEKGRNVLKEHQD